jgi:hypothetical protein
MSNQIDYLAEDNFENAAERGWKGSGWYFWDEADGQYCYGPYLTTQEAESGMREYAKYLYDNFK